MSTAIFDGHRISRFAPARPATVVLVFALFAVLALAFALRVRIDPGLEYFLLSNDPDKERNQEIKSEFTNDEIVVVGIEVDGEVDNNFLHRLDALTRDLEELPAAHDVISLTSAEDVRSDCGDYLDTSGLIDPKLLEGNIAEGDLDRILERLAGHRLFDGNLISRDRTAAAIFVVPALVDDRTSGALNQELIEGIHGVLERHGEEAWVGGYPAAEVDSNRIALRDLGVLTSAALLLILLVSFLFHRHWASMLFVLVMSGWSVLTAIAFFGIFDLPMTAVTATLPTILLAVASAYALYAFTYLCDLSEEKEPAQALYRRLSRPSVVSALSTSVGFLALCLMPIGALRHLGLGLAVGIVAALAAVLFLLPALVSILDLRPTRARIPEASGLFELGVRLARRPVAVLGVTAILVGTAVLGIARIEIESDPIQYWREDSYHRQSDRFLHERFDGSLWVNVVLTVGEAEAALRPDVLRFAARTIQRARGSEIVTQSLSLLDYLALIDDAMDEVAQGTPDEERRFLESPGLASQYMLLLENSGDAEDYENYVNFDRSALNVFLKVDSRSSNNVLALRNDLLEFANSENAGRPDDIRFEVLGTWLLFPKAMDGISRNMIRGLVVACLAIFVIMTLTLRSVSLGFISMIPNVIPIVACLGLMGWFGVPLSFVTSITGCLALGLAVDDTAHVLGHLSGRTSLRGLYSRVTPALLVTTACLGVGFLVLMASAFRPIAHMGAAAAVTLSVALLCDILLLPTLLRLAGWQLEESA